MTTQIRERSGSRVKLPEGKGDLIDIRIMGWEPGAEVVEGSSGDYPVAAIKRDFAAAFPVGTRMRANHDGICEAGGDVRRIMAKTVEAPRQEADGMYAHARVKEGEASEFIRQFADAIGVSVSVAVELEQEVGRDDDGEPILDADGKPYMVTKRSERGVPIVKSFYSMEDSPYNSIDFVEAPGADGRIVSLAIEGAKKILEHTTLREAATFAKDIAGAREKTSGATPPRNTQEKENSMDPEEISRIAEAAATTAVERYAESQRPSDPTPEQPTVSAIAEAVIAAGLTEAGRAEVYARLERGEAVEAAIAAESAREATIDAEVERRVTERLAKAKEGTPFSFGFTDDDLTGSPLGTESKSKGLVPAASFDEMVEV